MNTPKPRRGYSHRAELNTKFTQLKAAYQTQPSSRSTARTAQMPDYLSTEKPQGSFDAWKQEQAPAPKST